MSTTIKTALIPRGQLQAAADLIDRSVGKKNDAHVTTADLDAAQALVDKAKSGGAVSGLDTADLALIEKSLPALRKILGEASEGDKARPYATSLLVTAIGKPSVRDCARAIAEALGGTGGSEELTNGMFLDAYDAFRGGTLKPQEKCDVEKAKVALADAMKSGVINEEALGDLDLFFRRGQGGIMSHGPVRLNGIDFDQVFRLPTKGAHEAAIAELKKKDQGPESIDYRKAYAGVIADYEERFDKLSHDRVYVVGREGELYVALHGQGKIDNKIQRGDKASMKNELGRGASGEVIHVVDVINSVGEATWRPWVDGLVKLAELTTSSIKNAASKLMQKRIDDIADQIAGAGGGNDNSKETRVDLKSVSVAVAYVGTAGAAALNLPALLWAAGLVGGVVSASTLASYFTKSDDLTPVFHAAGVAVNNPSARRP